MRKVAFTLSLLFASLFLMACSADQTRIVGFDELPQQAKEFVKTHFPNEEISTIVQDQSVGDYDYDLYFVNGNKVEFSRSGLWSSVECKNGSVPSSVVPEKIMSYVSTKFGKDVTVKEIERRDRNKGYELKLSTGLEVVFNNDGDFVRIDD